MSRLPHCEFPTAADVAAHGIQKLPPVLPLLNMEGCKDYRSTTYKTLSTGTFSPRQMLQLTKMIADSFATREPMAKYVKPPKHPPAHLQTIRHTDPFGEDLFGEWTRENIMYWTIRLFILTDPASPINNIEPIKEIFTHSLVIQDEKGIIIGGALNLPVTHNDAEKAYRNDDPFLNAVYKWFQPIQQMLASQDGKAISCLCEQYHQFDKALKHNKVGIFYMIARSPSLPSEDSFELVAATVERFIELGYEFVVTAAANQWTGAAFELLNAVRVHFAPYRKEKRLKESEDGIDDETSSKDGYLSAKDSGCMFYVLRLQ